MSLIVRRMLAHRSKCVKYFAELHLRCPRCRKPGPSVKQFLEKRRSRAYLAPPCHGIGDARNGTPQFQQGVSMKKTAATLMFAFALSLLTSGCVVPVHDGGPGQKGGNFCPPGQAKKGNC